MNSNGESLEARPVCIWICGMAGTGKTTLANALILKSRQAGVRVAQLDGDVIRDILGERSPDSYTKESRERLSMLYGQVCLTLVRSGYSVIIASVSMSSKVSRWNRKEIPGYFEVMLEATSETLNAINKNNLYSTETLVVGRDLEIDKPSDPDLILKTDEWLHGAKRKKFDLAVEEILSKAGPL